MGDLQLDEAAIAAHVNAKRFRVFRARWVQGAKTSPVGIVFIAWVIYLSNGWQHAAIWATVMAVFEGIVFWLARSHKAAELAKSDLKGWEQALIFSSFFAGALWSASVWFSWSPQHYLLFILNMAGLVAVSSIGVMLVAPVRRAQVLYLLGLMVVPIALLLWIDIPIRLQIAAAWFVLFFIHMSYAGQLKRELVTQIEATARNQALIVLLTQARLELQQSLDQVNQLVTIDQLTGAYTRRYIFAQMDRQASLQKRHGTPVSIIMLDLDHFKAVNDRFGHPVGDAALRTAALAVTGQLRDGDLLARIGGEEFLVLLPMTDLAAAELLAERLRQTLTGTTMSAGSDTVRLPASLGVAELHDGEDTAHWYQRVDTALYQAKTRGRDMVVCAV